MIIGTSWGTISTLGIAFMGISNALGLSPIYTVSTIVSGAILGDKMSPLSSSVVLACQLTDTTSIGSMKAAAATNLPSFIVSAVIYILLGCLPQHQPVSQASEASEPSESRSRGIRCRHHHLIASRSSHHSDTAQDTDDTGFYGRYRRRSP